VIPIARPQIGPEEEAAVLSVMCSGMLAQGAQVAAFEKGFAEVCQVREAVAVSSGTAALHLALLAHGIGRRGHYLAFQFRRDRHHDIARWRGAYLRG
jgi:dTDP-4-amino-4,6-dideoxygalactose transaminase